MKFLLLQRIIYSFSLPKYNIRGIFIFLSQQPFFLDEKWNETTRILNQKFYCRSLNLFQIIVRINIYGTISKNAAHKAEKSRTQVHETVI